MTLSPDSRVAAVLLTGADLSLELGVGDLACTCFFSFTINTEVKDSRPDLLVEVRGFVVKPGASVAKVVFVGADMLKSEDYLFGSEVGGDFFFRVECPGRPENAGLPYTFTVGLIAQRSSLDQVIKMGIDAIEIAPLEHQGEG